MRELVHAFRQGWQTESYLASQGRGFKRFGPARRAIVWAWNRLRERVSYAAAPWLHETD